MASKTELQESLEAALQEAEDLRIRNEELEKNVEVLEENYNRLMLYTEAQEKVIEEKSKDDEQLSVIVEGEKVNILVASTLKEVIDMYKKRNLDEDHTTIVIDKHGFLN